MPFSGSSVDAGLVGIERLEVGQATSWSGGFWGARVAASPHDGNEGGANGAPVGELKIPGESAPSRKYGGKPGQSLALGFGSGAPSGNAPGNIPPDAAAFGPWGGGTRFPRIPPLGRGASGNSPCRIPPGGKASGAPCRAGKFPRMPPFGGVDSNEAVSRGLANVLASPACSDGATKLCNHQGSAARVWGA
jgi:hypothetical protein